MFEQNFAFWIQYGMGFHEKPLSLKGELISIWLSCILEFFQKTKEQIHFLVLLDKKNQKKNKFVREFLVESLVWKKHYSFKTFKSLKYSIHMVLA